MLLLVVHIYFFWEKEIKRENEIMNHRTKCIAINKERNKEL